MIWKIGMYLLFQKKIGKITKIYDNGNVKIRSFSKGNTERGYHYQNKTNIDRLNKLYKENKVRVIHTYDEVLACLFYNFEGCMPIRDVNEI